VKILVLFFQLVSINVNVSAAVVLCNCSKRFHALVQLGRLIDILQ
jgi:hypothetical protein